MTLRFTFVAHQGTVFVVAEYDEHTKKWFVTVSDFNHKPITDQVLRDAAVAHAHARLSSLRLHLWHIELRHP